VLDTALLAHFVSALTICKSKGITCNTFDLLVLTLDHKMSTALVALMPMKWAINPFFHLVKLILIAFCKSALSAIHTSKGVICSSTVEAMQPLSDMCNRSKIW